MKSAQEVFKLLIACGELSIDPSSNMYAGKWMFMASNPGRGYSFKNINTRKYITLWAK